MHDGALVAEFSQTLGVVGLDEFDDSGFGSTAGALEVFVGLVVQINRHVREVEGDFFLVDDFDGVQVGVGTQTADGDHLLESVVLLELLVNEVLRLKVELVLHCLRLVLILNSDDSHAVLRERAGLVRADAAGGAQGFDGLQVLDEHVLGGHALGGDGQRYGNGG